MAKITTENFKAEIARNMYDSFASDIYYIMGSVAEPQLTEAGEQVAISNSQRSKREFSQKVIFGNKITQNDVRYMFPKRPWQPNVVYDAYDDTKDVETLNMFVTVLDGGIDNESPYRVYKCIKNNNGAPSTINPSTSTGYIVNNYEVTLSDGYVWKFMFEVIPSEYIAFGTNTLLPFPYPGDPDVIAAAEESISDIVIEETRENLFSKYTSVSTDSGSGIQMAKVIFSGFQPVETQSAVKVVRLDPTSIIGEYTQNVDTFRNMHFVTPNGIVYDILKSKEAEFGPNNVVLIEIEIYNSLLEDEIDSNVLDLLSDSRRYSIAPKILVTKSAGRRAIAYAKLDQFGTIEDVIVTDRGSQYKTAAAQIILPSNLISEDSGTTLRCIVSPTGGHGSNPVNEMAMSQIGVFTAFNGRNAETPKTFFYSQVGLVKNPSFSVIDPFPVFEGGDIVQFFTESDYTDPLPSVFDNRTFVRINGDFVSRGAVAQGYTLKKDVLDGETIVETISALIHEVDVTTINSEVFTDLYLVDYDGDYAGKFQRGDASITRDDDPDLTVRIVSPSGTTQTAQINNSNDSVVYGNYKAHTGDLLHYVDFEKIERRETRQEKIKFVFDF